MINLIDQILLEAKHSIDSTELEIWHKEYLGKNSKLTELNRTLKDIPAENRSAMGAKIKAAKETLEEIYNQKLSAVKTHVKQYDFSAAKYDISGTTHPLTLLNEQISQIFTQDGFNMHYGEDITTEFYNFDALNTPKGHPSRSIRDTFYLKDGKLLRTHTTALQSKILENNKPPIRSIAYGNVYRRDDDSTHTPMFTQLEGLIIDTNLTAHHLKSWVFSFLSKLLPISDIRFRPSFFPFTYASAEVDIKLHNKNNWLELLGCGMVHPKILQQFGIDPSKYQGLAFGMGVERLAMLKWNISDIRYLYNNDITFLESVV